MTIGDARRAAADLRRFLGPLDELAALIAPSMDRYARAKAQALLTSLKRDLKEAKRVRRDSDVEAWSSAPGLRRAAVELSLLRVGTRPEKWGYEVRAARSEIDEHLDRLKAEYPGI